MKKFIHKSLLLVLCSLAFAACKPTLEPLAYDNGSADFSKYVSIGDGTAGGYANASLNREAQLAAFPNLLAKQFQLVGGGEFVQPLVEEGKSYGFENGKPYTKYDLHYVTFCDGDSMLYPEQLYSIGLFDIINFTIPTPGPYNNLAAQGTKMIYANKGSTWTTALGGSDTYWKKISSTKTAAATMLGDALSQKPTFVSINLGTVDVYRYGKSGGDQDKGNDDFITPVNRFRDSLYSIMNALTDKGKNDVKGIINGIIGVDAFPYFNYIKYDDLVLTADEAAELNTLYGGQFAFKEGRNAYVISDPTATNKVRQIKSTEKLIIEMDQDSLRCYGMGGKKPIRPRWVLDEGELSNLRGAVDSYNAILKAAADAYGFAFNDNYANMNRILKERPLYQGIQLSGDFVSGNYFSLDGLNITALGQAVLTNSMIGQINLKYGSQIPLVDVTKIEGILIH